ncbi:efflux RND transporter periplasmic adaptor subunit [Variovorax sp. LARHSF232]
MAACSKQESTAPAAQPADVSALTVKAQTVPVTFEFVGQTESSQQVEIRARVSGFLEKRVYTEGSFVKPGQVLFTMDAKPFQADLQAAKSELAQQQARLTTARANLNRVKPLVADNALSVKDLDDSTGQEQSAAAAVEAARAKVTESELKLGYTTITSPLAGLSSFAKIQDGAYVSPGNSLLTYVARLDPMRVNFSLSENESLRKKDEIARGILKAAPNDNYLVEVVLADGSVFPHRGRITFADASFSQETGTFLLRAELPNADGQLRPGQFVRVNVIGFTRPNSIVVPQRAVIEGPKGPFVWVVDPEGKAQQRHVEAGDWLGDQWLVSSGLKDGDKVVVDGFMRLAPGLPVKAKDVPAEPLPDPTARPTGKVAAATGASAAPAPTAAPSASAAPAAADADNKTAVYFAANRAGIDATGQIRLLDIAAAMKGQPTARATLHGYADASGNAKRNKELAKQRAQAVRDALVAAGVSAERIALQAPADITGGNSPVQARRVDIVLAGAR